MPACQCLRCQLTRLPEEELAKLESAALGLLVKAEEDLDLGLDEDDAAIMGTLFGVLGSGIGTLGAQDHRGIELTQADYQDAAARMQAQMEAGLELLSGSAAARLGPVLSRVNEMLAEMSAGNLNAIRAGVMMQDLLTWVEGQAGAAAAGTYSPYEWSRLCRTEAAFARSAAEREEYKREGVDTSAIDAHGWPALHPNCLCGTVVMENGDGLLVTLVETNPDACEDCQDWADAIMAEAGF